MNETKELNEKPNSAEISINAKGQYSCKIKVYAETIDEAIEQAVIKAEHMEQMIKTKNEA